MVDFVGPVERLEEDWVPREDILLIRLRTDPVDEAGEAGSGIECQICRLRGRRGNESKAWSVVESGGDTEVLDRLWKRFIRGWSSLRYQLGQDGQGVFRDGKRGETYGSNFSLHSSSSAILVFPG